MILLDTSAVLAAIDQDQVDHARSKRALEAAQPPLLLSPFVLAELDYLLLTRVGADAELAFLSEVADGAYQLEPFGPVDVAAALEIVDKYRDIKLGLADASIVVLAERHSVQDVLTLDERHFRAVRTRGNKSFRLFPNDR